MNDVCGSYLLNRNTFEWKLVALRPPVLLFLTVLSSTQHTGQGIYLYTTSSRHAKLDQTMNKSLKWNNRYSISSENCYVTTEAQVHLFK